MPASDGYPFNMGEEPPGRNRKAERAVTECLYTLGKGGGRAADQRTQGAAVVKQSVFRRADIGIRQHIGKPGRQADAFSAAAKSASLRFW